MSCTDCALAAAQKWDAYDMACRQCRSRALAASARYRDAVRSDVLTPEYRGALRDAFGSDWRSGHEEVQEMARRLDGMKGL